MFTNYTVWGDIAVLAICAVILILLKTSYVNRTRSLGMFVNIVISLMIGTVVNIGYHCMLEYYHPDLFVWTYVLYILHHAFLLDVFCLFILYVTEVSNMAHNKAKVFIMTASTLLIVMVVLDIILTVCNVGFGISENGVVSEGRVFKIGYLVYIVILAVIMFMVRRLLYKRIVIGFYAVMLISLLVRFGQQAWDQTSLTTMSFIFPIIAMLYVIHSNPYNVSLGSVDTHALEGMVRHLFLHNSPFIFMSLLLPDYDAEGKEIPSKLQEPIRKASANFFKNSYVFQIGNAHMVQIIPKRRNKDYERRIDRILEFFRSQYDIFRISYKIVIGESIDEVSEKNEYVSLIRSVECSMPENSVRKITASEIDRFNYDEYILQELTDIYKKKDLDDPRVLTYCQPVYNLRTGQFDTAEALMRLKLKQTGVVPPDQFIPVAESHGFIHVLTEIILNKTCREIKRLIDQGYDIDRISVNVSALEMKEECFSDDITKIIENNGISGNKIALELTESNSEADFVIMNQKIKTLRQKGIQFYLDDFGTGYSNMERIMEMPFDIIKFDRSLVIAGRSGERSEKIVKNLAHMLKDMDYSILYEGVEDSADEDRCREMSASYLQGFKYSRPIPIERLKEFLQKTDELVS